MGIILLIVILVISIILLFLFRYIVDENDEVPIYMTVVPFIFSIVYILTPLDFIDGRFDDILFLLIAIINFTERPAYDVSEGIYNFISISKFILLDIGLVLALINASNMMKILFTLLLILLLVVIIVCLLSVGLAQGTESVAKMGIHVAKSVGNIALSALDELFRTLDSVIDFIIDEYPNAEYIIINNKKKKNSNELSSRIRENLRSEEFNTVCALGLGIRDHYGNNLGNEEIYVDEELYNSVKTGEKYSLYN